MTEDIESVIKLKKLIEKDAEEEIKKQTGRRVDQAIRLSKGEDVRDRDGDIFSEMKEKESERRFIESFDFIYRLYWFTRSSEIMKIKDPDKLEEVLMLYRKVYDRTLEVLIELGEVGHIKGESRGLEM